MAVVLLPHLQRPPRLYRVARALRRVSVIVLVIVLLVLALEVASAAQVLQSRPGTGGLSAAFAPNDTVAMNGSFSLHNTGFLPISGLSLEFRILAGGTFLGASSSGPVSISAGDSAVVPIALYVPIESSTVGFLLLTSDQTLSIRIWANATYGYLFPVSIGSIANKSWGAPFAHYSLLVGMPSVVNGSTTVPVTLSFEDHASFGESGTIDFAIVSSGGTVCGSGSVPVSVSPQGNFLAQRTVPLVTGCSPRGGSATATYVASSLALPLPTESLP